MDCNQCGQNMSLSPDAKDEIKLAYEKGFSVSDKKWRERVKGLVDLAKKVSNVVQDRKIEYMINLALLREALEQFEKEAYDSERSGKTLSERMPLL
jgi:hypothetical protein